MKIAFISGYFNPLHGGHLDLIEGAAALGDRLVVIVNNDKQQMRKEGKIILDEQNRVRLMSALKLVDEVILSVDENPPVINTVEKLAKRYPGEELIFAQGGDRDSDKVNPETDICNKYEIKIVYGVGEKVDSSSRINRALGHEE